MFTFSLLYTIFYLYIVLALLVFTFTQMPIYMLTHLSTTNFIIFLQKYIPGKTLFLFLVFTLTGLPPVGLFFVKFNIFAFVLYQTHIYVICSLFLLFFLNMLYYTQLFNFKNFKKPIYHVIDTKVFSVWGQNGFFKSFITTYKTYNSTLFIVNVLLFLILAFLFFSDYFLITTV